MLLLRFRVLISSLLAFSCLSCHWTASTAVSDYQTFHAERLKVLRDPHGYLSTVASEPLRDNADTTVGTSKNNSIVLPDGPTHLLTLHRSGDAITLADAAPEVRFKGKPVAHAGILIKDWQNGEKLEAGPLNVQIYARADSPNEPRIRILDPQSPQLRQFKGSQWYALAAQWRVEAEWAPLPKGDKYLEHTSIGGSFSADKLGYAEFRVQGKSFRLTPIGIEGGRLFFVFLDDTRKVDTDRGGRFLLAPLPSNGVEKPGKVILDFNEATNPFCEYSPFTDCPRAMPENILPFAIQAGEKRYEDQ